MTTVAQSASLASYETRREAFGRNLLTKRSSSGYDKLPIDSTDSIVGDVTALEDEGPRCCLPEYASVESIHLDEGEHAVVEQSSAPVASFAGTVNRATHREG